MERGIEQPCALEIRTSQVLTLNNRGDRVWRMARLFGAVFTTVQADVVTDCNFAFEKTLVAPSERGTGVPFRTLAMMHAAMFEAANGIVQQYEPLLLAETAPPGARVEAAAIQAAYTILSILRPGKQPALEVRLTASLAALPGDTGSSQSIARGRAWGETVRESHYRVALRRRHPSFNT